MSDGLSSAQPSGAPSTPEGEPRSTPYRLRLYIAGRSPNSVRAEVNLWDAINKEGGPAAGLAPQIIDVFVYPRRAITDGVIVTPTLIGFGPAGRTIMMGDLADEPRLRALLVSVRGSTGSNGHGP